MSLRKISPVLFGTALLLGAAPLSAAGPSAAMLAGACAGCHGVDGSSVGPASPSIAGMSEAYFTRSMEDFKSGERPSTIMGRIARGYTTEEIELMAGFFAAKPFVRYPQQTDAAKVAKGETLYDDACETCHSEKGAAADDDSGILAGQWLPYMTFTMQDFISGVREMPKKMKKKVDRLDEAEIEALLQFFASQQ
jgi:sulfide dehydrogenase cytochrome subunit